MIVFYAFTSSKSVVQPLPGFPCYPVTLWDHQSVKVTVELSENDLKDILRFTGEKKKGPAVARLVAAELMMRRRRELTQEVLSGKFRVDFPEWEKMQQRDAEGSYRDDAEDPLDRSFPKA